MTLLDELTNDEVNDLKGLYEHKVWHQQIEMLVNRFNEETNLAIAAICRSFIRSSFFEDLRTFVQFLLG